jgi:glycosyltransferase involved in cell wall biosynthesis
MTEPVDISVVIPTFDMAEHLPELWASLGASGVLDLAREVVFVNDGSTDATREVLEGLRAGPRGEQLRVLHLASNVGRFRARLEGAKVARGERLLFLDTRLVLPSGFGAALGRAAADHRSVMGNVDIDVTRNVFCLYWERSHRFIFRRHYRDTVRELTLTKENYDQYVKGTGVLLCERDLFVQSSERHGDLFSDDTLLMKDMVAVTPITIHPDVRVSWVPRENARAFLARIWERGPGFVEYHLLEHRGRFFWFIVAGSVSVAGVLGVAIVAPPVALAVGGVSLGLTALSTALFARSAREAVRMMPLHVAVVGTFGGSVLRGLAVNARRALERRSSSRREARQRRTPDGRRQTTDDRRN